MFVVLQGPAESGRDPRRPPEENPFLRPDAQDTQGPAPRALLTHRSRRPSSTSRDRTVRHGTHRQCFTKPPLGSAPSDRRTDEELVERPSHTCATGGGSGRFLWRLVPIKYQRHARHELQAQHRDTSWTRRGHVVDTCWGVFTAASDGHTTGCGLAAMETVSASGRNQNFCILALFF